MTLFERNFLFHGVVTACCLRGRRTALRKARIVENNCIQKGAKENKKPQRYNERKHRGSLLPSSLSEILPGPNPGSVL